MKNYKLIPKITLWILMGIGIICSVLFFTMGDGSESILVAGDLLVFPKFTNGFLVWNYILIALVCLITLAVVIWEFIKMYQVNRKKAIRSLCVVIGFILLVVVCWSLGSSEEVKIIGYEGTDNKGAMAKLSDACLYLTYILTLGTIVALIWGVAHTKNQK